MFKLKITFLENSRMETYISCRLQKLNQHYVKGNNMASLNKKKLLKHNRYFFLYYVKHIGIKKENPKIKALNR